MITIILVWLVCAAISCPLGMRYMRHGLDFKWRGDKPVAIGMAVIFGPLNLAALLLLRLFGYWR